MEKIDSKKTKKFESRMSEIASKAVACMLRLEALEMPLVKEMVDKNFRYFMVEGRLDDTIQYIEEMLTLTYTHRRLTHDHMPPFDGFIEIYKSIDEALNDKKFVQNLGDTMADVATKRGLKPDESVWVMVVQVDAASAPGKSIKSYTIASRCSKDDFIQFTIADQVRGGYIQRN